MGTKESLREKLAKIGAETVSRAWCVTFQMEEVAISREVFKAIVEMIARLRLPAAMAGRLQPGRHHGNGYEGGHASPSCLM